VSSFKQEDKMLHRTVGAICVGLLLVGAAHSEEIRGEATFAWLAVGSNFMLGDGRPYFAGHFSGINVFKDNGGGALAYSTIQCPGFNDIGVDAAGYCIVTAGDGDQVFLKWSCKAAAPATGDLATCEGGTTVVGGTGKFQEASGGNDFTAHVRGVNADGTTMGYSELRNYVVSY
jgi:hypothetical protein